MKFKKPRQKPLHNGNGFEEHIITDNDEKINNNKRKTKIEKDKQPPFKKNKTEKKKPEEEPAIRRSDSPGIDLSIFQPRGKRKCVLQNELKKQQNDDWFSDDEEEIQDHDNDKMQVAKQQPITKHHSFGSLDSPFSDEDGDEIEEEIPDSDQELFHEKELEIKEEELSEEEIVDRDDEEKRDLKKVTVQSKPKLKKKTSQKQLTPPEKKIKKTVRCFVFSTAMANRAAHAVNKGLYSTISKYHHAKWEGKHLKADIHCRPFNAQEEDELEEREQKENIKQEETTPQLIKPEVTKTPKLSLDKKTDDKKSSPKMKTDSSNTKSTEKKEKSSDKKEKSSEKKEKSSEKKEKSSEKKEKHSEKKEKKPRSKTSTHTSSTSSTTPVSTPTSTTATLDDIKANPLHPRFNLINGSGSPSMPARPNEIKQELRINGTHTMDVKTEPQKLQVSTTISDRLINGIKNEVTVIKSEPSTNSEIHNSITTQQQTSIQQPLKPIPISHPDRPAHPNASDFRNSKTPPQLVCSKTLPIKTNHTIPPHTVNGGEVRKIYPADIKEVPQHFHSPKDFAHLSPKEFGLHKLLEKPLMSAPPVPPPSSMHKELPPREMVHESARSNLEAAAEKARIETRLKKSPPILPRDIHPSAFISPRERDRHARPPFNGYSGGITPNGNPLLNPHLRNHSSFSPPNKHHYSHSREAIENIVDFSRNSVIIPPPPVRPSATRVTGFSESKTYEDYVPRTSSSIHQRKDRPSSLPVTDALTIEKEKTSPPLHSAFSVDSLTKLHPARSEPVRIERSTEDEARMLDRHFSVPHHPPARPFHDRIPFPHDIHGGPPHERLHVPNGINIHNNLKRTLDEQLSSNLLREQHAEHRKFYHEQLEWIRKDKRLMVDYDRIMAHRPPTAFPPDPRSPFHVPVHLPPRHSVPTNGHHRDLPSPPGRRMYSPYGRR
eukprot:TCONS_00057580-protein